MNNAAVIIGAGSDTDECHSWVGKLAAMYERWAKLRNLRCCSRGKSPVLVWIENAYDLLANEKGVHGATMTSPFDGTRVTTNAYVNVLRDEYESRSLVRRYILSPYKMVKDYRTGIESDDVDAVMRGHIDEFLSGDG